MLARYKLSGAAGFMSVDPLRGAASYPQSWNRYGYVLSNPVNLLDPLGLSPRKPDETEDPCGGAHTSEPVTCFVGKDGEQFCSDPEATRDKRIAEECLREILPPVDWALDQIGGHAYVGTSSLVAKAGAFLKGSSSFTFTQPLFELGGVVSGPGAYIFTSMSKEEFFAADNAWLLVHEYWHLVQWSESLTNIEYWTSFGEMPSSTVWGSNPFEFEAKAWADAFYNEVQQCIARKKADGG